MIPLLYILGFIASYAFIKKVVRREDPAKNNWSDIFYTLLTACLSWLGLIISFGIWFSLESSLDELLGKPPKWL